MINATLDSAPTPSSASDPTMERLAPRSSRRRNGLLLLGGVVVLVGAVFSTNLLRPSVSPSNGAFGGSWSALPTQGQIMTINSITAQNWPRVDVRSVQDVDGAEVVGAWVITDEVLAGFDDGVDETGFDSGTDYLQAAIPALDISADALPHRLDGGESAQLLVLWNVLDCDALLADPPAPARVELRSIALTGSTEQLPDIAAPGFDVELLHQTGTCP